MNKFVKGPGQYIPLSRRPDRKTRPSYLSIAMKKPQPEKQKVTTKSNADRKHNIIKSAENSIMPAIGHLINVSYGIILFTKHNGVFKILIVQGKPCPDTDISYASIPKGHITQDDIIWTLQHNLYVAQNAAENGVSINKANTTNSLFTVPFIAAIRELFQETGIQWADIMPYCKPVCLNSNNFIKLGQFVMTYIFFYDPPKDVIPQSMIPFDQIRRHNIDESEINYCYWATLNSKIEFQSSIPESPPFNTIYNPNKTLNAVLNALILYEVK